MGPRTRFLCASLSSLALPATAAAHGTAPAITQIVSRSTGDLVVATTRGLLFGDAEAQRWSLLCGGAFGAPDDAPYWLAAPPGRLLVASLEGLVRSDDDGCTWRPHPTLGDVDATYLAQAPARPEHVWLSVFGGAHAGIHASEDGGETFRRRYAAPPEEFVGSLAVGAQDALLATVSTTEETPRFFVLRSTDAGATWQRTTLALAADVLDVGLLAVNPAVPDEVLLRVFHFDQRAGDALLRSVDGGASFVAAGRFVGIAGATFTPDGATVFLATSDGLLRASASDYAFVRIGDVVSASHVAMRGDAPMAGVAYPGAQSVMPGIAVLAADGSAPPTPLMTFAQVTAARSCAPPSDVDSACEAAWADWSREYPSDAPAAAAQCTSP